MLVGPTALIELFPLWGGGGGVLVFINPEQTKTNCGRGVTISPIAEGQMKGVSLIHNSVGSIDFLPKINAMYLCVCVP